MLEIRRRLDEDGQAIGKAIQDVLDEECQTFQGFEPDQLVALTKAVLSGILEAV